jgi:benzoate membrane transport protein
MLAGVILSFCTAPFSAITSHPAIALPVIASWLIMYRIKPLWAAPIAITVSAILMQLMLPVDFSQTPLLPTLTVIAPHFELSAIVSLGIPLYIVTMASQNVPGIAIMRNFGYEVPFKAAMASTGIATVLGSFFGGQAMNLAAITAAINADEHADKDPKKRWVAAVTAGIAYVFVALAASVTVAFILQTPRELLLAGAGLALVGTITNALQTASSDPHHRIAAVITFLISASGISEFGIGAAFWALVGGLISSYVVNFKKSD